MATSGVVGARGPIVGAAPGPGVWASSTSAPDPDRGREQRGESADVGRDAEHPWIGLMLQQDSRLDRLQRPGHRGPSRYNVRVCTQPPTPSVTVLSCKSADVHSQESWMSLRVLHVGLGPIGTAVVRQVASRKGFVAVGAVDIDPGKVGKDLGEVAGIGRSLRVAVTDDAREDDPEDQARRRSSSARARRSSALRHRSKKILGPGFPSSRRPRSCPIPYYSNQPPGAAGSIARPRRPAWPSSAPASIPAS